MSFSLFALIPGRKGPMVDPTVLSGQGRDGTGLSRIRF